MLRFTIEKRPLLAALKRAAMVTPKRHRIPCLAHVVITAHSNATATITAYSDNLDCLEQTLTIVPAESYGTIAVPLKGLIEAVKAMAGSVSITQAEGKQVVIGSAVANVNFARTLPTIDHDELPSTGFLPMRQPGQVDPRFSVSAGVLPAMLAIVAPAMSTDETRLGLMGVRLERERDTVRVIASDGHRLATTETAAAEMLPGDAFFIPAAAVKVLRSIDEPIGIDAMNADGWQATTPTMRYRVRDTTSGMPYPDWRQVMPNPDGRQSATIEAAPLVDALKSIPANNSKIAGVAMTFNGSLAMRSDDGNGSVVNLNVPAAWPGAEFMIGFNAKYWLDAIAPFPAGSVVDASFAGGMTTKRYGQPAEPRASISPVVLSSPTLPGYQSIVMPMRL